MRLFGIKINDSTTGAAAPARDAALGEHRAALAEFRRQRALPENTVICGQESDPGRLGRAARELKRMGLR